MEFIKRLRDYLADHPFSWILAILFGLLNFANIPTEVEWWKTMLHGMTANQWRVVFCVLAVAFLVAPYLKGKLSQRKLTIDQAKKRILDLLYKNGFEPALPLFLENEFTFRFTIKYGQDDPGCKYLIACQKQNNAHIIVFTGAMFSPHDIEILASQNPPDKFRTNSRIRLEMARAKMPYSLDRNVGFNVSQTIPLIKDKNFEQLVWEAIRDVEAGFGALQSILSLELPEMTIAPVASTSPVTPTQLNNGKTEK